jgi:hypothetical protein
MGNGQLGTMLAGVGRYQYSTDHAAPPPRELISVVLVGRISTQLSAGVPTTPLGEPHT